MDRKVAIFLGLLTVVIFIAGIVLVSKTPQTVESKTYDEVLVKGDSRNQKGPENAKITIVEFADFQCPACSAAYPYIQQILSKYPNDVRIIYRHFPLNQHPNAFIAAEASEAAREQGKFWEMYDLLYTKQNDWSTSDKPLEIFLGYAKEIGLNEEQFKKAVDEDKFKSLIDGDTTDAFKIDVDATPTFYINNQKSTVGYNLLEEEVSSRLNQ